MNGDNEVIGVKRELHPIDRENESIISNEVISPNQNNDQATTDNKNLSCGESNGTMNSNTTPICKNCHTSTTPLWRRDELGAVLCNACGLFLKLHGRPRPISLKTDVIKSRNRKITNQETCSDRKKKHDSGSANSGNISKKRKPNLSNAPSPEPGSQVVHSKSLPNNTHINNHSNGSSNNDSLNYLPHLSMLLTNISKSSSPQEHLDSLVVKPSTMMLSPQLTPLQRNPSYITSVNDILNVQKQHDQNRSGDTTILSPRPLTNLLSANTKSSPMNSLNNIQQHTHQSVPLIQAMINNYQQQTSSLTQYPISSPPIDLQKPVNINSFFLNNCTSQEKQHLRTNSQNYSINKSNKGLSQDMDSPPITVSQTPNPCSSLNASGQEASSSLASLIQSQEEVIKLRTKINELELVTDLYKRHIFELDSKCRSLEHELSNYKR